MAFDVAVVAYAVINSRAFRSRVFHATFPGSSGPADEEADDLAQEISHEVVQRIYLMLSVYITVARLRGWAPEALIALDSNEAIAGM